MRTYTNGVALYQKSTKNSSSAQLTSGVSIANDIYRKICELKDWPFLEQLRIVTTTAATAATALPYDCEMVREVSVTPVNQTKRYTPQKVRDDIFWDQINLTAFKSDIPEYYYIFNGTINLWPTPVSTGNQIRITQKTKPIDMSVADITTGSVTAVTNGDTSVTVSGVTLTSAMAGMYINFPFTPTGTNSGDGQWYLIAAASGTTITLARAYGGPTISSGSLAVTIGQAPLLPEAYHDTMWIGATARYWRENSDSRADAFEAQFDNDLKLLGIARSNTATNYVIDSGEDNDFNLINPNLTVTL